MDIATKRQLENLERDVSELRMRTNRLPAQQPKSSGTGSSLRPVIITSAVSAATYNPSTNLWTPSATTVALLVAHEDGDGKRKIELGKTVEALSYYLSGVSVSAGQGRLAYLSGRELIVLDCTEFTLPESE